MSLVMAGKKTRTWLLLLAGLAILASQARAQSGEGKSHKISHSLNLRTETANVQFILENNFPFDCLLTLTIQSG